MNAQPPWHVNARRGEVIADIDGKRCTLRLTLGALAELEAAFDSESLLGLAERFDKGRFSARDCRTIIGAALRGAGEAMDESALDRVTLPGGAANWVRLVMAVLEVTFGTGSVPSPPGETAA